MKYRVTFEYPRPTWTNRDPEIFDNLTMFNLSFRTTIHYVKNHSSDYEEFLFAILGFGVRIEKNWE